MSYILKYAFYYSTLWLPQFYQHEREIFEKKGYNFCLYTSPKIML